MKGVSRFTWFSETGKRPNNQDACQIVEMPERTLLIVCDGMGGHALGDIAAQVVSKAICDYWTQNAGMPDSFLKVKEACKIAWQALDTRAHQDGRIEIGTTMVLASIEKERITIAHCGDSRCYLLRNGRVMHQTQDHADLRYGGAITRCFFTSHPQESVPEIMQCRLQEGDRIFLCSDGVYRAMRPEILTGHLQEEQSLESITETIKTLCEEHSNDNYTGILAQIDQI